MQHYKIPSSWPTFQRSLRSSTSRVSLGLRYNSNLTKPTTLLLPKDSQVVYEGPYSKTFKYLKLFSLSSLGLSTALSPFIFILESSLPTSGRIFLAGVAISTTTFSTYLISLFTSPYVTSILRAPPGSRYPFVLGTMNMFLQTRRTFISDQGLLATSERPLTVWKLKEGVVQGEQAVEEDMEAVTTDSSGKVLGRWVVKDGLHSQEGSVVRYFNVHPELLESKFSSPQ